MQDKTPDENKIAGQPKVADTDNQLKDQLLQHLLKLQYPMTQEDPATPSVERETQQGSTMDYHQRMEELIEMHKNEC